MKKEMLINVLQPEECRIAIVEGGVLEELYVERTSQESYVGNIYKGRIVNIEPSIQAAFVDFGIGRNGFLHVSDVEPAYYRHLEPRGDNGSRGRRGMSPRDRGRTGDWEPPPRRRPEASAAPTAAEETSVSAAEVPPAEVTKSADTVLEETVAVEDTTVEAAEAAPMAPEGPTGTDEVSAAAAPAEAEVPEGKRGTGKGRRSRGRSRRRGKGAAAPKVSAGAEGPTGEEAAPVETPNQPEVMESAERRTAEGNEPIRAAGPQGLEEAPKVEDEDIFFPRTPAPGPAAELESAAAAADVTEGRAVQEAAPPPDYPSEESAAYAAPAAEPADVSEPDEEFFRKDYVAFDEEEDAARRRTRRDDRSGTGRGRLRGRGPSLGRPKPLIQDIFKRGQEVLVQVIKEGIGTKGPTLSTYISIAGRYLVLMPGLNRVGVSRKITDEEARRRLRDIFNELQPPKGLGFIIRTAGIDKNKKELQRDLAYLSRLWQVVVGRIRKRKSPCEIYQESDMITRTIRDTFTADIDTIWVDEPSAFEHAQEFLKIVMPRYANRIKLYTDKEPLFHKYGIEEEIARIQQRHVPLPNGGSIVIDQTEALVAIDVNSGNFRADNNAEETAYRMNLLAAKEIARQLRLRDLGGVIVNDFIDMREERHRRDVERALREAVKRDRARTKILKISAFGIIEMTRQRIRPSLKRSVYQDCPYCHSTGQVKTCESMSIDVMRMLQLAAHKQGVARIEVHVHQGVANYLSNRKRKEIARLEEAGNIQVNIIGETAVSPEMLDFHCYDSNNNEVRYLPYAEDRSRQR